MSHKVKILACSASEPLAKQIAKSYGLELGEVELQKFSDGEFGVSIKETVRGCDVFIIQSTTPPQENLMEMLLMIDAAKRASAHKIVAVLPYFGWARQDRKDQPRVAIGAKLVANMLVTAGVNRVMTMDLHADQIQGFFEVPVDHLFGSTLFAPYLKSKNPIEKSKTGLGLGLFIGKTLLEKNFASINCRNSKTRSGAEVIITWRNKDLFNI